MCKLLKAFAVMMVPLFILSLAMIATPAQPQEEKEKEKEDEPYVYTNEDLKKYATEEEPEEEGEEETEEITSDKVEEMIKELEEPEKIRRWKEAKIKAAEERIKQAEMRLDYLRKKKASIQNPLLPRPEPTEEDAREESGMDNVRRLERTEKQIGEAEEELDRLEKDYEELITTLRAAGI